jgi:hypothetical protein
MRCKSTSPPKNRPYLSPKEAGGSLNTKKAPLLELFLILFLNCLFTNKNILAMAYFPTEKQYRERCYVSLLCSEWEEVVP